VPPLSHNLSSWRSYAAASIGGAAGGVAALYTGGVASGAVGGATYSVTNQLLTTGSIDIGRLAFDTGISAFTAGIGSAAFQAGSRQLSNATKGEIGEAASLSYNWLQGSRLLGTQEVIPGFRTRVDSVWQSASGMTYYVESKFGTAGLTAAQREARSGLGDAYQVERWGYDWVGRIGANLGLGYGLETSASTFTGAK